MARICYLLLCHKEPLRVVEQANLLTRRGDFVSIHFDARASAKDMQVLRRELSQNPGVCFAKRVRCGWGEWSLVQATLNAARVGLEQFGDATHFYLISGDCIPIKSANRIHGLLDARPRVIIEHHDFFESGWIKTGLKDERLIYRFWVNERKRKFLFYALLNIQRWLKLERSLPENLPIRIGSQWWCLRRETLEAILNLLMANRNIERFFRSSWIPDESFFQTIASKLVPEAELENQPPTFLNFSDYGLPAVYYDDHADFLLSQQEFFARKVSPDASGLRQRSAEVFAGEAQAQEPVGNGRRIYDYLTRRGRVGQRYASRAWEQGNRIGASRRVDVILCKKWHVGERFSRRLSRLTNGHSLGYILDDDNAYLPDLGGAGSSLEKRRQHPLSLIRLVMEILDTDRIVVCIDPHQIDLISKLAQDPAEVRFLEIGCEFSDEFLTEHAARIGLFGAGSAELAQDLIKAICQNIHDERTRLRGLALLSLHVVEQTAEVSANALQLSGFLGIPETEAAEIAADTGMFH